MMRKCKKLQTICLGSFPEEPLDSIFEAVLSQASTLKYFQIESDVESHSIPSKLSNVFSLTNLEKLDLDYCFFITDPFLEALAKHCKKLDYLDIGSK